jgi:tryptophanyl-tRNA synthetase
MTEIVPPVIDTCSFRRVLTGIKPTGSPHLGNYVGAIKPAIDASIQPGVRSYYFLADLHALIGGTDPGKIQRATLEIAASWLALGLDPNRVAFYRQSDVYEIAELNWLLSCVAAKGLLNRAHAYKAAVDHNEAGGHDPDLGVSAGLYTYPVLMSADILMFNAHAVPVGRDQVQHIEIARDIAQRFNHLYGAEYFTLPCALVDEHCAVLPGLDGRKMSKSYDNTIGLFLPPNQMRAAIGQIVTNSKLPGETKATDESALFAIYQAFATDAQSEALSDAMLAGMAWGEVKARLSDLVESKVAPARERYQQLIAHPGEVEDILRAGAVKVRLEAAPFMARLRDAVGLRALNSLAPTQTRAESKKLAKLSTFKDSEGFRFKLIASDQKTVLLESIAFDDARGCGQTMAALKAEQAIFRELEFGVECELGGAVVANGTESIAETLAALAELR